MAYRGRGRGRGRGGFGGGFGLYGTPEPFILFPDGVVLPDINDIKVERALIVSNNKLQNYWKSSPYYLEKPTKKSEGNDIERYSDSNKTNSRVKRLPHDFFLKLNDKYFAAELLQGKKERQHNQSKGFSYHNKGADQLKFDLLMNLEQKYTDRESKGGNEKKNENESDSEGPEDIGEESSEESEGDYEKPENADDDDDDYNDQEDDNPDDDKIY